MEPVIKVGDKVIGLANWYSEPHIGTVLLTETENVDPLHDLLINISKATVSVSNIADYKNRFQELSGLTGVVRPVRPNCTALEQRNN